MLREKLLDLDSMNSSFSIEKLILPINFHVLQMYRHYESICCHTRKENISGKKNHYNEMSLSPYFSILTLVTNLIVVARSDSQLHTQDMQVYKYKLCKFLFKWMYNLSNTVDSAYCYHWLMLSAIYCYQNTKTKTKSYIGHSIFFG